MGQVALAAAERATALLLAAAVPAFAHPGVTIAPARGAQSDTFTVAGNGLSAGLALDINFSSPGGIVFSTATQNQVVVARQGRELHLRFFSHERIPG
jgi:hypothetical protein